MFNRVLTYFKHPSKIIVFLAARNIIKISDEKYLKMKYKTIMNKKLDLDNTKTFNEKLQYLKLYDRKDVYTKMVDKYEAKKYVASIIGSEYIIPTIGVYNSFDEIDFNKLPRSFVMKCTHDSGGVVIVKDKNKLDKKKASKKLNKSLKHNFFYFGREWPYKNVNPRIIIEEYMGDDLEDYKLMCFNGKVECSFVCTERYSKEGLKVTFFDRNWNKMPFERHYPYSKINIKKPMNYEKMIKLAEKLSKNIPFVRVDFYNISGKIYFGELTFYPGGGYEEFTPEEWDYKLGEMIDITNLPNKTLVLRENGVNNYLIKENNSVDISTFYRISTKNIICRIVKKYNLNFKYILNKWSKKVNEYNMFILFDIGYSKMITKYIKKKNKNCKIIMWYWNPINEYNINYFNDKNIDEFYSYDREDCKKYGLKFNTQFYNQDIVLNKKKLSTDILFLGADKGRSEEINKYSKIFKEKGFKTNIIIIKDKKDFIEYQDYLSLLSGSKVILDIVNKNVKGLSLRPLESLFLEKKLITNNQDIVNYDFYNKNNIFVLEKDNIDELKRFVNSPYKKIDKKIVYYYDYQNWIKRFK